MFEAQEQERLEAAERARIRQEIAEKHKQEQENILAILDSGKLPDIDWNQRHVFLPFKFMQTEHLIYAFT